VLSRIFAYAEETELRAQNTNPCTIIKSHPEKSRKRHATADEIPKIAAILDREKAKFPNAAAFIYLLIYSGSRPSAIERATWDQLQEFEHAGEKYGLLTFKGKTTATTGEDERIIIPPQAMKVIDRLPRIDGKTITGIKMPRKLWARIKKEAGCTDLWARDLRRTFATVGMTSGIEMGMISPLLNHKSVETTKIYAKVMNEKQIETVKSIADTMEKMMGVKT
jgi:integrase